MLKIRHFLFGGEDMAMDMMGASSGGATASHGTGCVEVHIRADDSLGAIGVAMEETWRNAAALVSRSGGKRLSGDGRVGMNGAEYYVVAAYRQSG